MLLGSPPPPIRANQTLSLRDTSKEHACRYHPAPFGKRHDMVSWDGGGDSWDSQGWFCCLNSDRDAPGCATGPHLEKQRLPYERPVDYGTVDYEAIFRVDPIVKRDDSDEDVDEDDQKEEKLCDECKMWPCTCDNHHYSMMFVFDDDFNMLPRLR